MYLSLICFSRSCSLLMVSRHFTSSFLNRETSFFRDATSLVAEVEAEEVVAREGGIDGDTALPLAVGAVLSLETSWKDRGRPLLLAEKKA